MAASKQGRKLEVLREVARILSKHPLLPKGTSEASIREDRDR